MPSTGEPGDTEGGYFTSSSRNVYTKDLKVNNACALHIKTQKINGHYSQLRVSTLADELEKSGLIRHG